MYIMKKVLTNNVLVFNAGEVFHAGLWGEPDHTSSGEIRCAWFDIDTSIPTLK